MAVAEGREMTTIARLTDTLRFARALLRELELAYLRWARSEIDPLHPDLSYIVLRINALESERHA